MQPLRSACTPTTSSRERATSPLVIGHRGAPGYMPEHTLASYALAIELGADYIEPDLVMTKDGHLIARHEPNLTATTDVSSRAAFAGRLTTKVVDGVEEQGWFASDFTLAANLKYLNSITNVRLVQLVDGDSVDADGIGPWKPYLLRAVLTDGDGNGPDDLNGDGAIDDRDRTVTAPTSVIADAHARGLLVHTWTFRSEQRRLASAFAGVPANEYLAYYRAGIDGVFADFQDDAYATRVQYLLDRDPRLLGCLTGATPKGGKGCINIAP